MARSKSFEVHGRTSPGESTLSLHGHAVRRLHGSFPYSIEVLDGIAYITREGDLSDYVVKASSAVEIDGPGAVVVEGFPDAEIKISA